MKTLTRRLYVLMVFVAALVAVAGGAIAQSPSAEELMSDANERYSRGEYAEAAQQYEALLAEGFSHAALYYNLGNAYFQQGDLGRAILNYLRAERLSPRDSDIRANLDLARSNTVDNLQVEGDSLVASMARLAHRWATPGEMGAVVLILWIVGGISLATLFVITRSRRLTALLRAVAVCALLSALVALPIWLSVLLADPYSNTGVVIAETVEVVNGPGSQYATAFTLHSGAQARLVDSRQGWILVELPGGELWGWVPEHGIEAVGRNGTRSSGR